MLFPPEAAAGGGDSPGYCGGGRAACSPGGEEKGPKGYIRGGNEGRVTYLEKLGWQVEPEPVETLQIKLPADLKGYEDYLALQTEQGLPFADCGGKVVCRYTYRVTNYPGGRSDAQVNLLQCDGAVVAGRCGAAGRGRRGVWPGVSEIIVYYNNSYAKANRHGRTEADALQAIS